MRLAVADVLTFLIWRFHVVPCRGVHDARWRLANERGSMGCEPNEAWAEVTVLCFAFLLFALPLLCFALRYLLAVALSLLFGAVPVWAVYQHLLRIFAPL